MDSEVEAQRRARALSVRLAVTLAGVLAILAGIVAFVRSASVRHVTARQVNQAVEFAAFQQRVREQVNKPPSHLADPTGIQFDSSRYTASATDRVRLGSRIAQLSDSDKFEFGATRGTAGPHFAAIGLRRVWGAGLIRIEPIGPVADAVLDLVESGPKSLPLLLAALDDTSPTHILIDRGRLLGGIWYAREVPINSAHSREMVTMHDYPKVLGTDLEIQLREPVEERIQQHAVTRGDIAFVVLGQILNRDYVAVREQPTACIVVNSPTHDSDIAAALRALWSSSDPPRTLFESLLTDFRTRGGDAHFQVGAAMRLAYYFVQESRDMLAHRIDGLDVRHTAYNSKEREAQVAANGDVEAPELLGAFAFSTDPVITAALVRTIERTDDPSVLCACLNESVAQTSADLVFSKVPQAMERLRHDDTQHLGLEWCMLGPLVTWFPDRVRPLFERAVETGDSRGRFEAIRALRGLRAPVPWAVEVLMPLLDDRERLWDRYSPSGEHIPVRVCDLAAEAIVAQAGGTPFKIEGSPEDLDRAIDEIRHRIAARPSGK